MKKRLLSAFAAAISLSALHAQPTLSGAANNPFAGDVYVGHAVDSNFVVTGASGASVTWNFASIVDTATDTTTYYVCASTPYCDSFSGSNIASFDGADYTYFNANPTAFSAIGAFVSGSGSGTGYIHFSDPRDFMRYPFTYNGTYLDTTMVSSGGVDITVSTNNHADAYGTLILPSGTFTNALRVHTTTITTFTVLSVPLSSEQTESYTWYKPGFHSPLYNINLDTAGGPLHITDAKYYTGPLYLTSGVSDINGSHASMQVYPNPATDAIHVKFNLQATDAAVLTITDVTGRAVATINSDQMNVGSNDISYTTANIPSGIYVVKLHSAEGNVSQKVVVSK